MRILALFAERVSLLNAETVLLVGYDEREGLELDIRLDYCVGADEQVDFSRFEGFFFRLFCAAVSDPVSSSTFIPQPSKSFKKVL